MNKVLFFRSIVLSCIILNVLFSCARKNEKLPGSAKAATRVDLSSDTSPEGMLFHYWYDFDFKDTIALRNPDIGEQHLVDFIARFPKFPDTTSSKAIKHMLSKAKPFTISFEFFKQQYERYLYDPNSPMRNDLYYKPVLEFLLDSCRLSEADKYIYSAQLALIKKNNIGTPALDFEFQIPTGEKRKISSAHAPFVLLFFYEPGCPHCETAIEELRNSTGFSQLVNKGVMNVLAIYALGDHNVWQAYQSHIPATWTNGFDSNKQVLAKGLYDIRASPTIYLLDKDKKVLLKDTDLSKVALYFNSQSSLNI
ncbi:DUF5106 domain-containing protein [Pedobacter antarcticus]|uniref:DUF5106 domain-containing protein n=1 Tax=Pedobacter antarcticus TaxID=34086 RepID=UPI001C5A0515|nr:DUF5106 domain-containing protein [Pedobacter antarcticus]